MKLDRDGLRWFLLGALFFFPPLFGQVVPVPQDPDIGAANVPLTSLQETSTPLVSSVEQGAPSSTPYGAKSADEPYPWRYGVYPVMGWAPIFGTSFTLPPHPSNPVAPSGSTNSSFNGAYFGGARVEPGNWSADFLFMWAALTADRKTPFVNVHLDFVFGDANVGHTILPGLYGEVGFRRLAMDIDIQASSERVKRSPGYWDPLLGLTWRRQFGKKWRVLLHGDGGGFGVGSDVDVAATGRAEWQFVRHCVLAMGYGGMHFSETNTVAGQRLKIAPTMHGPILGVGAFF